MADTLTGSVRCPFYKTHNATTITCEGIFGTLTRHSFSSYAERIRYILEFCCLDYKKCPHYKTVIEQKYGGEV